MSDVAESLRKAILSADRQLSRFDPLEHILFYDEFDEGINGWIPLGPDYDGMEAYPGCPTRMEDLPPVALQRDRWQSKDWPAGTAHRINIMLSSLSTWDVGSTGSWNGTYVLKLCSAPVKNSLGYMVKRISNPWWNKLRFEAYLTFKADYPDYRLGQKDVNGFIIGYDFQDPDSVENPSRFRPCIRYYNADEQGNFVHKWQAQFGATAGFLDSGTLNKEGWTDVEDGQQEIPFNRAPTKYQFVYLRFTVDLASHTYVDLYCHGKEMDVAGQPHSLTRKPFVPGCPGLLNVDIGVLTNTDKRAFLLIDSIVMSASG
jgi:hypothetical protein